MTLWVANLLATVASIVGIYIVICQERLVFRVFAWLGRRVR